MTLNQILSGSALEVLKTMPDSFVDCCITSPPYWGLRDYGVSGQLGLEPTFNLYISHLIQIFNEVKRVLKPTGTCWVNLGDSYNGTGEVKYQKNSPKQSTNGGAITAKAKSVDSIQSKSLCCIPDRFKIAMVDSDAMDEYELRGDLTEEERKFVLTELTKRGII